MDHIIEKSVINPRRIFDIPEQPETWVEVDEQVEYEIQAADQFTRCGWTPFEGWKVKGKVTKVVLRGKTAFEDGKFFVEPGYGRDIRKS
jgi:carbamoyl-phosphate synthase/aspartate carbamoyltransferase/dihydroorotase